MFAGVQLGGGRAERDNRLLGTVGALVGVGEQPPDLEIERGKLEDAPV